MTINSIYGYATDVARNMLVESFLKEDADYMLMLDNDCSFTGDAVGRLLLHQLPMVCGMMYTRNVLPQPTIGKYLGKNKSGKHIYEFGGIAKKVIRLARENGIDYQNAYNEMVFGNPAECLVPIDGCGMHFTLIRRDVVESLHKPYFVFEPGANAGEDFYLCRRVRLAGFPIHVDIGVQSGHIDSEDHIYGIRELLYVTQYIDLDEIHDGSKGNWEVE